MAPDTVPATNTPPPVGRNVPVRLTQDFHDDLTTLMANGRTATDVIREAVRHMADAYRCAHDYGDMPHDQDPRIMHAVYAGQTLICGHTVGGSEA